MAVRKDKEEAMPPSADASVPPPVAGGYANLQSLGHLVDEMMRHSDDGEAVGALLTNPDRDIPSDDPEPITPPPPVPDGEDQGTRGGGSDQVEAK